MTIAPILDSLNDAQRDAVAADAGNLLVLAGAGSGKTRVLAHRIAWLVHTQNIPPHKILAVTFTNKAAREMRSRIEELLKIPSHTMWVGTFHGLAHRLLKMHWQEAGLPQNFQILDADDQLRLVKRISKSLDLDDSRWPPKQTLWFINAQKDEGLRAVHLQDNGDLVQATMIRLYQAYEEACERGGMVDFAELLLRAHELWLQHPELLQHYQQRFQAILVDEFQDTNRIQYAWLRVLAGQQSCITAVGDDDQSIYGWRGARIENIQQFSRDFPDTRIVRLEQNYRSTQTILKAANAVIFNNRGRLGKELWTNGDQGEAITLYAGFNEIDEARFIVERIVSWVKQGHRRDDVAILYRSNAQSRALEEALLRVNMPYRVYGGQRFYDRLEIKNALAYLRLICNRHDDAAFERAINTPTRGIGNKTLEAIREHARANSCSLWRATLAVQADLSARAAGALEQFTGLIDRLSETTLSWELADLVDYVLLHSGLLEFHQQEKGEKALTRVENLEELVSACRHFAADSESTGTPLQQFLDGAALDAGDTQASEYEDCVQLMTLHSAKGLEFPMVFMAGMEENLFPHIMSMNEPGRLEEERRLCYVGITRAMQHLTLSYAESRRLHGKETFNGLSRFVKEIPPPLLREVRIHNTVTRPVTVKSTSLKQSQQPDTGLSLGQQVVHAIFGKGVILNFEGQGASARVQVNFNGTGSKWLVLQYAKLKPL